ncbi:MAG: hypothetical protein M3209_15580 [Acidobacteriota bacterium]|nr:hypothetical protein [Acidobacteriota bacterium]
MNFREIFNNVRQAQPALIFSGFAFAVLFFVLAIISFFDSTEILGINRWIKPMKFASSIAIYLWTLAVYLYFLNGFAKSKIVIAWGVIAMMSGEIILILMQAARGTTSHFNVKTPFDNAVFAAMGLMILINSLLLIYLTFLYFRSSLDLPRAIVWGFKLGLVVFLLGSAEGGYMSAQLGHSVGVQDGGAGLPFVNWSTEGGDLRVAHFLGLHAFQAIPLAALFFVRWRKQFATALTLGFALAYFAGFSFIFIQAAQGKPLFQIQRIRTESLK